MKSIPVQIAVRAYVVTKDNKCRRYESDEQNVVFSDIVAVIDTETTNDAYLNLLFGSFGVWISGRPHRFIVFHAEKLSKNQLKIVRKHVVNLSIENANVELMPVSEFIDQVFYPLIYDDHARLVGFNLPFDISRLAVHYGVGRGNRRDWFVFTLSRNSFRPSIRIKSINKTTCFIEFSAPPRRNQRYHRPNYAGRFLDLHTLYFALTNETSSLTSACKEFQTQHQKTTIEYGKVTSESIDYNVNDVLATYDLYTKLMERYNQFQLDLMPEKAYSPASIGKQHLKQMGVKSFLTQNPDFPYEILGYIMSTYYGGRSEVRIRKKPVKVRYMDFTSLYPSLFSLINLWQYLTADKVECIDATNEIQHLVKTVDLDTLRERDIWKDFTAIVQVKPENDILPIRAHYESKFAYNIGLPYVTSSEPLWYALPDVIASKLLTGKPPKVIKAIKFIPMGKQTGLSKIKIICGYIVSSEEDLFHKLIELRKSIKEEMNNKPKDSIEYNTMDTQQQELKIIANSTSYGVYVQVDTESRESDVNVYGIERPFKATASKIEKFGPLFHPIIATMLTSGARLMLAMAEAWIKQHNGYYAFCDTDSIAVSPFHWKKLQQYFQPLNPFSDGDFLKLEEENLDETGHPRELRFYGISAKRYVLYTIHQNGEPIPVKWSSHGLGHLVFEKESDWEKQLWTNILRHALRKITEEQLVSSYSGQYAIQKLVLTKPSLLARVRMINKKKSTEQRIKPYNFVLVGQPVEANRNGEPIIPLTPFVHPYDQAPYQPFVDANSGRFYNKYPQMYWKKLDHTIRDYISHPESKFENGHNTGKMRRHHVTVESITHIGKESNELEKTEILGLNEKSYVEYVL